MENPKNIKNDLWKTTPFLWKTCGKDVENFGPSVENFLPFLVPVENSHSFPQVFHRHLIAVAYVHQLVQNVFHIFHRPYYYYLELII